MNRSDKAQRRHIATDTLSSYLDGQLPARQREQVKKHLDQCAICSQELETLRYTSHLLKAMPTVPVPRAFTLSEADVGISPVQSRSRRLSTYLRGASAAVAAILVVVVVGDVLQFRPAQQPQEVAWAPKAIMATQPARAATEVVIEREVEAPAERHVEAPAEESMLAPTQEPQPAAVTSALASPEPEIQPVVVEEAPLAQPQAEAVEEPAATAETVVIEKAVEPTTEADQPPQMKALSVTPEDEQLGLGGGGPPPDAPPGMGGGGAPDGALPDATGDGPLEQDMLKEETAPESVGVDSQEGEQVAAQPAPAASAEAPEPAPEAEVAERAAAATEPLPSPTSEPEPSPTVATAPTEAVQPSPTAQVVVEPRPTPIQSPSPTPLPPVPQSLGAGWWSPLRSLEVGLGSLFVVFLALSVWFRRR